MKYIILSILFASVLLVFPMQVLAEDPALGTLKSIGSEYGPYQDTNNGEYELSAVIGVVIQAALALIGAIFIVLVLYAGYHWMTARGEEDKVEIAKDTLQRAIIGIIIVVGAYAIWNFIFVEFISK